MSPTLVPMTPDRLASYLETTKAGYIGELILAGNSRNEAQANADRNFDEAFPGGQPGNGNEIFTVTEASETVGVLWIGPRNDTGSAWWVFDIEINEQHRRRGLGRATMLLAEVRVRELGGTTLGLNVFGHNPNARALYESLGFEAMSIQMRKQL
jgi:ribosomal protein S18 acetylase RimI-like enzyme